MKLSAFKKNRKGGFTLIELMVVIAILAALASVGYTTILQHMKDGDRQKALSNLQSVSKILIQFNQDNGSYPCDATAAQLSENNAEYNFGELTGDTSNPYYRQVFFSKSNTDEKPFYALSTVGSVPAKEGDNKLANGQALTRGENAMGYVMSSQQDEDGGKKAISGKGSVPIAICGVYPSKTPYAGGSVDFDLSSLGGHVFLLSTDGAVKDLEDELTEDDDDEAKGHLKPEISIFPETKKGKATADRYIILSPDL